MHQQDLHNASFAYLLLRVILGVNICVHGVSRLIAGNQAFAAGLVHAFQTTPLPGPLVYAFAWVLPWSEAILGLLILIGLFRQLALLAGGAMLVALTFGSTLRQDWESAGLQLIYALVYAILLAFLQYDCFAADSLLRRGRAARG